MPTNVREHTTQELLDKVRTVNGFKGFPSSYWIIGIQSVQDEFNTFDDKFYLMQGSSFITVVSGTTNSGADSLLSFTKEKLSGSFVWKTDEWYYDLWSSKDWNGKTKYKHKGKMIALRQDKPIKGYRDSNKNKTADQEGKLVEGVFGCNFHTNTYLDKGFSKVKNWLIGGWSWGCQVINDPQKYYDEWMPRVYNQDFTSYVIIKDF